MRGRNNNNRKGPNPLTRSYESNGPDVKIRGSAQQIAEKYTALARDAMSSGDRVMAENYLQHAEHYNRIIAAAQAQMPIQQYQERREGDEDEFDDERDEFDLPSFAMPQQSQGGERGNGNGEGRDRHEGRGERNDNRGGQGGERNDNRERGEGRGEYRGDNRERGFNGPRGDRPDRAERDNRGDRGDRQDRYERRDRNGERGFDRRPDNRPPEPAAPVAAGEAETFQPAAENAPAAAPALDGDVVVTSAGPAMNGVNGAHLAAGDGAAEGEARRPRRPRRPRRAEGEDARNPAAIAAAVESGEAPDGP